MGILYAATGIKDSERPFTSVEGQRLVWTETQKLFEQWNAEFENARKLFVQGTTTAFKERYELAGGGEAEALAFEETDMGPSKRTGSWDVAYQILVTGGKVSRNRVSRAYLTMGQWEANIETVFNNNNNTQFRRILTMVFKNTNTSFTDPIHGALTLVPLANQDGTLYPPLLNTTAEAEENYYLATSYVESGISNSNNPFRTIRDKLEPRFGYTQGGSNIVTIVNPSAMQYIELLADFVPVADTKVGYGDDVSLMNRFPAAGMVPSSGRVEGTCAGCWVVSWPRMPSQNIVSRHMDMPAPLMARYDEVGGLGDGTLQMINSEQMEGFPNESTRWIHRCGYAVGNRLGAVVLALRTDGTYTIPTGYSTVV